MTQAGERVCAVGCWEYSINRALFVNDAAVGADIATKTNAYFLLSQV